jgi:hypothetical protein
MTVKVVQVPALGEITLKQSSRSGRIRLSVKPGGKTIVSYPLYVSSREAVRFATQNADWIAAQRRKLETMMPVFSEESGFRTRLFRINFRRTGDSFILKKEHSEYELQFPSGRSFEDPGIRETIRKVICEIYRQEAKIILLPRLSYLASKYGFRYGKVTIRNNKTNWGSCSAGNNISLNLNLMKLPDHLIDYILLHELAHTKVRNHGPAFWKLMDELTGNQAHQIAAELRKFSSSAW